MSAPPVRLAGGRLPLGAAGVTALVLTTAALRAALSPLGDGISTAAFAAALFAIAVMPGDSTRGERRWGIGASLLIGLGLGFLLLAPFLGRGLSPRPLGGFWQWGGIAAAVAILEEVVIRGRLQRTWSIEAGPVAAIVVGATVFALIHLPRYGAAAMPLDLAVGLALGGLRSLTGRVLPGAIAHVMADWGAWFLA